MKYKCRVIYFDDKQVDFELEEPQLSMFVEATQKNEFLWDAKKDNAFFLPQKNVRYLNVFKTYEEEKKETNVEEKKDGSLDKN